MSDSAPDRPTRGGEPPAHDRLESWKEIAAYLDKDVGTVQRWERRAGLPVHRHSESNVRNVYASRSELDSWQNQHRTLPDNGEDHPLASVEDVVSPPAISTQAHRWWARWPAVAAGIVVAVVVTASLAWVARNGRGRPPEPLVTLDVLSHEGDRVLITRFENLTGETLYDGTLRLALERELSNSSVVRVTSPERVEDALRLMKRPVDTVVDASVGREVALRDGGIRVILTGHIEKFGPTYVLTVQLLDPQDGRVLASVSEDARDESAIFAAVRRQASRVRATLGEALPLIRASERRLEKVTTPSLRALQLYSRGYARYREEQRLPGPGPHNHAVSAEFFRQAIADDPEFASAYNMLGWSVRFQDDEEALRYWARAVELSPSTTERDRLFIEGVYYDQTGQLEKAVAKYEALLRLHPDHFYAANNLTITYRELGLALPTELMVRGADSRPNNHELQIRAARLLRGTGQLDRATVYFERAADLRPTNLRETITLVRHFLETGDVAAAEPYIERARALASAEGADPRFPGASFLKVDAAWVGGDAEQALAALNEVVASGPPQTREARDSWLFQASLRYQALGMLDAAHDVAVEIDADSRYVRLAFVAWARDDRQAARDHLRRCPPSPTFLFWLARAGAPDEAREALEAWKTGPDLSFGQRAGELKTVRGELARLEGRLGEAIPLLEEGLAEIRKNGLFYLGSDSLALAWLAQGEPSRAARVLDEAAQAVPPVLGAGSFWLRLELRRVQVYRQLGRVEEAEQIEAGLRTLLAHADPDHVILRELTRLS